ncbi:MAG: lipoate--protein ligase [Clostridia bacterium]|nr:lipoate--protein ligase [Clostridia bacterium]
MLFFLTNTLVPGFNLACEEYFLKDSGEDVFMLWRNSPVVVIGKNQNVYDEVDLDFAAAHSVGVIRRITGGGAVYHDTGNVNYSYITSRSSARPLDFDFFTRPMIAALDSLGITSTLSGRNDLLCGEYKISGSAQFSTEKRTLHHGTLLFDVDMDTLAGVLKPPAAKLASKHIASVRSRVSNLRTLYPSVADSTEDFMSLLGEKLSAHLGCEIRNADLETVKKSRYVKKYFEEDYNFGRRIHRQFKKSRRWPCGTVVFCFDAENGRITSLEIEGDFFPLKDTDRLAADLVGAPLDRALLIARLEQIDAGAYFPSVTPSQLANQITE